MNRWTLGLLLGFATVLVANGILVWVAVGTEDPIDRSYETEAR